MGIANKRGTDNERAFARFMSEWLGTEVRRNDARVNAGDSARNSDVDVEHELLEVRGAESGDFVNRLYTPLICKGITAELKYRSSEFKTIYKWMKECRKDILGVMIVNDSLLICRLVCFPQVYKTFVQDPPVLPWRIALRMYITHKDVKTEFKTLHEGSEQAARYGKTKKLFPIQVIRMKGEQQLVVIRVTDLHDLNVERGYIYDGPSHKD